VHNLDYYLYLLGIVPEYVLDDYYTYLDGAVMRNVYRIKVTVDEIALTKYFDFVLNYDSMLRTWSIYINESNGSRIAMYKRRATGASVYANLYNPLYNKPTLQLLDKVEKEVADVYPLGFTRTFQNFQLVDTGYRAQAPELYKRFRELQFKVNNLEQVKLEFYSQFYADDEIRKGFFRRGIVHVTDPLDPNYGLIYVTAEYQDPAFSAAISDSIIVDGSTVLNEDDYIDPYDIWYLDGSMFPTIAVNKVRVAVSGKGYAGRFILLSRNEHAFQLLNINWVFRQMMAR
jgi:hypothetical protein